MSATRNYQSQQHFLKSPRLVAELIGHSNIRKNDIVYDLGAGSGIISYVLSPRCKKVHAIESDANALQKLYQNLKTNENVEIVNADILSIEPSEDAYKIFANIPFSLSAKIVRQFTEYRTPPTSMYLVAQKQFARKLVPGADHFTNQLSAELGPWFTVKIKKPLRKSDFTPPPAVDTVLLEIKKRPEALLSNKERSAYKMFITRCFENKSFYERQLRELSRISAEKTASQLTLDQWVNLFKAVTQ